MNKIGFLFSLYESRTGDCIVTKSVSGNKMAPVLREIAKIVNTYQTGENQVVLKTLKVRLGEDQVLTNPQKMDSLNTLLTLATEHYAATDRTLIIETNKGQKSIIENLKKILTNPQKTAKLVKELDLPSLDKGDILLVGKFKNRKAVIKGFDTDENGQPVALTDKGPQKIFKPRVQKLMNKN